MADTNLVYTTYIKTTPEKLWAAITNPEFARQYWGGNANVSDWKQGSQWRHETMGSGGAPHVVGEVFESVPPRRLVLGWASPADPADVSRVSFDIEQVNGLVRLVVTHAELKAGSGMAESVSKGWPLVLSSLKSFLETGVAIDIIAVKGPCGDKAA